MYERTDYMLDLGRTSSSTMGEWVLMPAILWEARDSPYRLVNFSSLDFVLSSHCVNLAVKLGDTRVSKAWIQMGKFSLEQTRPCYFKNKYMSIYLYFCWTYQWLVPPLAPLPDNPSRPSMRNWWFSTMKELSSLNMGTSYFLKSL